MSWLALIIVGVIIAVIAHYAPLPHPLGVILLWVGIIMAVIGVVLLLLGLFQTSSTGEVDVDGMARYSLVAT